MAADCSDADLSRSQYDKIHVGLSKGDLLVLYQCAAVVSSYADVSSQVHEVLTWTSGERSISVDLVNNQVLTKDAYGLKSALPVNPAERPVVSKRDTETPANSRTWEVSAGDSFRYTTLAKWTNTVNWWVVWDASLEDIELRAAFVTTGNIEDAIRNLMDALPADIALRISMYRTNNIVHVHNPGL